MRKILVGALLGAAALTLSSLSASAAVVCNGNVCWHTHDTYRYPPSAHIIVHPDEWRAGPGITFHEHEGRGYWNGDRWIEIER